MIVRMSEGKMISCRSNSVGVDTSFSEMSERKMMSSSSNSVGVDTSCCEDD